MGSLRVGHDFSDFTFTFHFRALEKEMATHPIVLAGRIPGMGEPGGLPCMGSHSRTRLKRLSSSSRSRLLSSLFFTKFFVLFLHVSFCLLVFYIIFGLFLYTQGVVNGSLSCCDSQNSTKLFKTTTSYLLPMDAKEFYF